MSDLENPLAEVVFGAENAAPDSMDALMVTRGWFAYHKSCGN